MKSKKDIWDIEKLETTPVRLSKLSNVVKIISLKKSSYNELIKKVYNISTTDNIGTSDLVKNNWL